MSKIPNFYSPTTVHDLPYFTTDLVRPVSYLGDKRRDENYSQLSDCLQQEGLTSLNRQSDDDAQRRRYSRLLNNNLCDDRRFIEFAVHRSLHGTSSSACSFPDHYIIPSDGSQIALKSAMGQLTRRKSQLGRLNDNKTPGIHIHACLAMDARSQSIVGLSDLILFERSQRLSEEETHRHSSGKTTADFSKDKRETYAWQQGADNSRRVLGRGGSNRRTHVFDRDGDSKTILNHLLRYCHDRTQGGSDDFVIRCQYRKRNFQVQSISDAPADLQGVPWLNTGSDHSPKSRDVPQKSIEELLNERPFYQRTYKVELRAFDFKNTSHKRRKRKKRKAKIKLKSLLLAVMDSDGNWHRLHIVQAWENPSKLPKGERKTAINWLLLTNNEVTCFEQALEMVGYYRKRWHIEQLFRVVKKQGLQVESAQLGSPTALKRLIIMMMENAAKVLKLVGARSGETSESIRAVFDKQEVLLLKRLNLKYEGKTEKQKNPYQETSLSYGAWIIARMGGWKGYKARLPGPITMERGLDKFLTIFEAWTYIN
ncbi:MAG: IS4 family transposase [Bacteroidota bacterium]